MSELSADVPARGGSVETGARGPASPPGVAETWCTAYGKGGRRTAGGASGTLRAIFRSPAPTAPPATAIVPKSAGLKEVSALELGGKKARFVIFRRTAGPRTVRFDARGVSMIFQQNNGERLPPPARASLVAASRSTPDFVRQVRRARPKRNHGRRSAGREDHRRADDFPQAAIWAKVAQATSNSDRRKGRQPCCCGGPRRAGNCRAGSAKGKTTCCPTVLRRCSTNPQCAIAQEEIFRPGSPGPDPVQGRGPGRDPAGPTTSPTGLSELTSWTEKHRPAQHRVGRRGSEARHVCFVPTARKRAADLPAALRPAPRALGHRPRRRPTWSYRSPFLRAERNIAGCPLGFAITIPVLGQAMTWLAPPPTLPLEGRAPALPAASLCPTWPRRNRFAWPLP